MLVYLLPISLMPIYGALYRKKRKLVIFLCMTGLFLLLALRDSFLGVDLNNYYGEYRYVSSLSFGELIGKLRIFQTAKLIYPYNMEGGYVLLTWIFAHLNFTFHGFLVMHAVFCMASVGVFIERYSKLPWLSCMMYACMGFYIYNFGILRQSLSMCICLWTIPHIKERNLFKFLLIFLCAFEMHRAALVFLPMYVISNYRFKKENILKYTIACSAIILGNKLIFNRMLAGVILHFGKSGNYIIGNFKLNNLFILMAVCIILITIFVDTIEFQQWENRLSLNALLWALIIEIFGMNNDVIARSVFYIWIFICLLIPNIVAGLKVLNTKNICKFILPILLLVFLGYQLLKDNALIPYKLYYF